MTTINVPTREEVSAENQAIFDDLKKGIGFVPNLYATFAHSETALGSYLAFQNAKSSLRAKEREIVNLVVSQVNGCRYCQSAHTALGKMHGLTEAQILEIRGGEASFNPKFDALAKLVKEVTISKGHLSQERLEGFFKAGYTKGNLVDVLLVVGDKIVSNYSHNIGGFEIDFPIAPELELELELA